MSKLRHILLRFRKLLKKRSFLFIYFPLLLLILALPVIVLTSKQKQNSNQYASAAGTVLYVATTGSDSNPCTQIAPCATIQHASGLATAGTTIHVAPGTYNLSNLHTTVSGTAGSPIVYVSDTKWGALLRQDSTIQQVWWNDGNYVNIVGFDISGGQTLGIYTNGSHTQMIGNLVHDFPATGCPSTGGAGIEEGNYSATNTDVIGNVVHDIGPKSPYCNLVHGIYMANINGLVQNNISYRNAAWGIHSWHGASNLTIANNLVYENLGGGIFIGADGAAGYTNDNTTVSNNIVIHNHNHPAIYEYGSTGIHNQYLNNLIYGNDQNILSLQNGLTAQNTLTVDPQLVNYQPDGSGDYHLAAGSPSIDSGTNVGAPVTDFDGNSRPQGAGYDRGPYEYVVATTPTPTVPVAGSVTFDAASIAHAASVTTLSWSHTTSAQNNRLLVVGLSINNPSVTATSITYNGSNLTKLTGRSCDTSSGCEDELWYLVNPATGTNTISVTLSGASNIGAGAATYYNVDQTTPLGAATTNSGNSTGAASVTVSSTTNQLVIDAFAANGFGTWANDPTQTQSWLNTSNVISGGSRKSGSSAITTMTWNNTGTSDQWAEIVVPLNPVSSPTPTPSNTPLPTPTNTPVPLTPTPTPTPVLDTTPPTVTVTSPKSGTTVRTGATITLSASASDNIGVTHVDFLVNGTLICSDTISPYTCNWTVPGTANVLYTITAQAYDAAGNASSNSVQVTAVKRKNISVSG